MKKLLILLLFAFASYAQSVVKDTANVRKPSEGKLYYSQRDKALYLYRNAFVAISKPTQQPIVITPPVFPIGPTKPTPPTIDSDEIQLGYWAAPERLLIAKKINGLYYLMQTNTARGYYVARGINLINNHATKIDINSLPSIVSQNSELGGLYPATNFPEAEFLKLGFQKNTEGEFIKSTIKPVTNPTVPNQDKISVPVGLIMWDNWERDYWNDPKPKYDYLINHISRNRYAATYWGDKFNLVPFYGEHIAPEIVKIRYNIQYNQSLGRNTFDELERIVNVKYDKTPADTEREVKYYRDAGFDFLVFNYYNVDSYLSETRQQFQNMSNKQGMKMTIMCNSGRSKEEIEQITAQMLKDYWFRINNKPVLYMTAGDFAELPKYQSAFRAKGGGDIYVVYYSHSGYPTDWSEYVEKRNNAISAYNTSIGGNATQEQQISKEVSDRENWMRQYKHTDVQLIPLLSLGIENLDSRTDLGLSNGVGWSVESANTEQIARKCKLMQEFIKKYPEKIPAILWYSANEINEGGRSFVPKKLKNGKIDTTELDAVSAWQN